jgi:hypothetical protein
MQKGDFTAGVRLVWIAALAIVIGVICAFVAVALLWLIGLFTQLFYHPADLFDALLHHPGQLLVMQEASPAESDLGWVALFIPVLGGLIIGLMARYGSERIRGHGIPEAIEAILIGRSRMSPRVAILKPLSSAVSIGSGAPFGAEGPIIMTGGACGSIVAQMFHLTAAERKTLLVAGAAGVQGHPAPSSPWRPTPSWAPPSGWPRWPSACWRACSPCPSRRPSTAWRTCSTACPSTGCGGRPSAGWRWASSATT